MFLEKTLYNVKCKKYYIAIQKEFIRLFDICTSEQFLIDLVKESKMDIDEIHLADITEQYLDYIKDVDSLDLESASEFIQVASMLIEIKSKAISKCN